MIDTIAHWAAGILVVLVCMGLSSLIVVGMTALAVSFYKDVIKR